MQTLISHVKECFGFVPVAEFWEAAKAEQWDFLIMVIIGASIWFYIAVEMIEGLL